MGDDGLFGGLIRGLLGISVSGGVMATYEIEVVLTSWGDFGVWVRYLSGVQVRWQAGIISP